jgi:hypothetical protein
MGKIKNWSRADEELPQDISVSWENDPNQQIVFIERIPPVPSLGGESVKYQVMITDKQTKEPEPLFSEWQSAWQDSYDKVVEWMKENPEGSDKRTEKIKGSQEQ